MTPTNPLVSIIIAAYNRGNVLRYAIMSVLRQTFSDWELLIVDDSSTDDTPDIVASFQDQRIRYIRLPENIGEQSGPNNEGFRHARGRYIAYLSQDDLWFPDHLEKQLHQLESTGADWVFSLAFIAITPTQLRTAGFIPGGVFHPRYGKAIVAALWLLKREVLKEIGGWRFFRTIRTAPSQDLLMRAWRAGKKIIMTPYLTGILIHSGQRRNSYVNRDWQENKNHWEKIDAQPVEYRLELLKQLLLDREAESAEASLSCRKSMCNFLKACGKRTGMLFGVYPQDLYHMLRYFRKGAFIDSLRKKRGLPPLKK